MSVFKAPVLKIEKGKIMSKKISTISWIWDNYSAKFTEIRKAINGIVSGTKVPTKNL